MLFRLFLMLFVTSSVSSLPGPGSDVRCRSCSHVESPEHCLTYEVCNAGEVCFTHEVFDHSGARTFRLGCEVGELCSVVQAMAGAHILGRRDQAEPAPSDEPFCFRCCSTDDCNAALCQEVLGLNRTQSTPSHPGSCPAPFIKGPNSCLYFQTALDRWPAARGSCLALGGDLVKVEDRTEDNFILEHLRQLTEPHGSAGFWTGARRDIVSNQYLWPDNTPVHYARWAPGEPSKERDNDLFIVYGTNHLKQWVDVPDSNSFLGGFVCERGFQ